MTKPQAREQVAALVRRLNESWVNGRFDALKEFFQPDAVLVAPGFTDLLYGRDAIVQTYREFLAQATLHAFEMREPRVDVFASTAIAVCPYTTEYSLEGRRWRATGHDVLVFVETAGEWSVAWRMLAAGEEHEVPDSSGTS